MRRWDFGTRGRPARLRWRFRIVFSSITQSPEVGPITNISVALSPTFGLKDDTASRMRSGGPSFLSQICVPSWDMLRRDAVMRRRLGVRVVIFPLCFKITRKLVEPPAQTAGSAGGKIDVYRIRV